MQGRDVEKARTVSFGSSAFQWHCHIIKGQLSHTKKKVDSGPVTESAKCQLVAWRKQEQCIMGLALLAALSGAAESRKDQAQSS